MGQSKITRMINIVYAYKPEVKALKVLLKENNLHKQVKWYKWPSVPRRGRNLIVNVGFVGGLNTGIALGQVVLIDKVVAPQKNGFEELIIDGPQQELAKKFAENNKLALAGLLTVSDPVTDSLLRDELSITTKADVVDMEAHNLFLLAKERKNPFISFKVVTDNADSDTLVNIKQKGELWSKILAQKVVEFLWYLDGQAKLAGE